MPISTRDCASTFLKTHSVNMFNSDQDHHESTFFDLGDNTALVCVDHQQYQKVIVPQLIDMTYKVHLGLFEEDVSLKLKTYNYDVVLIYENFKGATVQTNPLLREM